MRDGKIENQIWVTGASGVLGGEIARYLAGRTTEPVKAVVRRETAGLQGPQIERVLHPNVFIPSWMDDARPDSVIIHCAGMSNPRATFQNVSEVMDQQVLPNIRMLEGLLKRGWRGRLIYLSSGGTVYGEPLQLPIPETHPCNPINDYGIQKLFVEQALSRLARTWGFELLILRVSNPYGSTASKPTQGVVPILFNAFQSQRRFEIFGDGSAVRDYLYVDDFNEAVECAVRCELSRPVEILNIGAGKGVSINQLIQLMGDMLGRQLDCVHRTEHTNVSSNVLDCRRARDILGWQASTSLEAGLDRSIAVGMHQSLGIA